MDEVDGIHEELPRKEPEKICGVCGARALGYNFNAITCESCKAFFRRNALKKKEFRCPFTEDCVITPGTRRYCQKCRLDKCLIIGMRKENILTEEDLVRRTSKIEENREKERLFPGTRRRRRRKRDIEEDFSFDNDDSSE